MSRRGLRLVFASMVFAFPEAALAVPASPDLVELRQPNGRTFIGRLWGDERGHGWETDAGRTVLRDEATGYWHFAHLNALGKLERAQARPGIDAPPTEIPARVRPAFTGRSRLAASLAAAEQAAPALAVPSSGAGNVPVLLVNFADTSMRYAASDFQALLFGSGTFSMRDYYSEVSYGRFTVESGPSGIGGWYTASNGHDYYGTDVTQGGNDAWPGDLVYEAATAADAAGYDFAPYDQDGDCYVDNLVVVHQGSGQEYAGAPATNIWSHSWSLSGAAAGGRSHYGALTTSSVCAAHPSQHVVVNRYTIQPELYGTSTRLITVGVFAHEFGHALGLPDLYDTDGSSQGIGNWSVMASGSWNRSSGGDGGNRPAHFDAWSKWRLGWISPTAIGCSANVNLPAVETSFAGFFRLLQGSAPSGTGEYFLAENRQKTGFDVGLPAAGLLLWHVDEARPNNNAECYPGDGAKECSATVHYEVALVQADDLWQLEKNGNYGDAGDPFPGSTANTAFDDSSSPNAHLYSGAASGVSVTAISASAQTMTATLAAQTAATLAVTKAGTGTGTVTSAPAGISCEATCSASYACGAAVALTATASAGSLFSSWSGDCAGTGACDLVMNANRAVTATFGVSPPALRIEDATVVEGDGGTKTIRITVKVPAPSAQPITVDWTTGTPSP